MSDWSEHQVGPHVSIISGFPFNSKLFDDESGVPLIRIRDLASSQTVTKYTGTFDPGFLVHQGDVLIGMDGDFNVVRWRGREALLNQRIMKIVAKSNGVFDTGFLYYRLGPYLAEVNGRTAATTVKHLSVYDITRATLLAPKRNEQRKIARILTTLDNLIEKTEALIAKYQAIKQGMMHDLFTRGVDSSGQLRPTQEQAPDLYKQSELGWIPKEWDAKRVCDIADVKGGKRLPAGEPFSDLPTPFPYIRVSDMDDWTVDPSNIEYVPRHIEPLIRRYKVSKDDIYISIAGVYLGLVGLVPDELDQAQLTENAAKIVFHDIEAQSKQFVVAFFNSTTYRAQLEIAKGVGGGVPKLGLNKIEQFVVPLPKLDEQKAIENKVFGLRSLVNREAAQLGKLQRLKSGLMQDLLTGEVRVKVDAPEEVTAHA